MHFVGKTYSWSQTLSFFLIISISTWKLTEELCGVIYQINGIEDKNNVEKHMILPTGWIKQLWLYALDIYKSNQYTISNQFSSVIHIYTEYEVFLFVFMIIIFS